MSNQNLNIKKYIPFISFVLIFTLFLSLTVLIGLAFRPSTNLPVNDVDTETDNISLVQDDSEVDNNTTSNTSSEDNESIPDAPIAQQPSEIVNAVSAINKSMTDLKSSQLVTVKTNSVYAVITLWQKDENGIWVNTKEYDGFIGFWGASSTPSPESYYTPIGLFDINEAFGFSAPETKLEAYAIGSNTVWVTNEDSENYYSFQATGEEGIKMIEDNSLEYGFVIGNGKDGLNDFFLCCGDESTQGRIAMTKTDVLDLLKQLDSAKKPQIMVY